MMPCKINGCERGGKLARGMCPMHYERWRRHGDPLRGGAAPTRYYADPEASFVARSEPIIGDPGCIIWTGTTDRAGYGSIYLNGRMVPAHRYSWTREHGEVPAGMEVDHMCWEPSCVNVRHLRLATRQQNSSSRSGRMPGRKHDLPRGVYRVKGKYVARAGREYFGLFQTASDASLAAQRGRDALYKDFAGAA